MYDDSEDIDYLFEDKGIRDLFRDELADEIITDFTDSRMRSFYEENPEVATPALRALADARFLLSHHPTGAFMFAAIAAEVGLRSVLLRPIVHGLFHSPRAADVIAELAIRQNHFTKVLLDLFSTHGVTDLRKYHRSGASKTLWEELDGVSKKRNHVAHRADVASLEEAEAAIAVAACILEDLFEKLAKNLGFHLHGPVLCDTFHPVPKTSSPTSLSW